MMFSMIMKIYVRMYSTQTDAFYLLKKSLPIAILHFSRLLCKEDNIVVQPGYLLFLFIRASFICNAAPFISAHSTSSSLRSYLQITYEFCSEVCLTRVARL